jgi:hypothetical protein
VAGAISDGTTLAYVGDAENYRWFLLMCNMPFFAGRLDYGSSIRSAWWDHSGMVLESAGLWVGGEQLLFDLELSVEQWREFIAAVRAFAAA